MNELSQPFRIYKVEFLSGQSVSENLLSGEKYDRNAYMKAKVKNGDRVDLRFENGRMELLINDKSQGDCGFMIEEDDGRSLHAFVVVHDHNDVVHLQ